MDKMKKALMIVAMVAIIAIAGSMIYYFVFFRTEKERTEIRLQEEQTKQEQANKGKLKQALDELDNWYNKSMSTVEVGGGMPFEQSKIMIDLIENRYKTKQENIYKLYDN